MNPRCFISIFVLLLPIAAGVAQESDSIDRDYADELPRIQPLEPADALKSFKIHPGFRMELVAAEPLVFDPIAMAFDESGRMYVVEMRGYSERRQDMIGAIRLLEDTNGDGVFDESHVFADGLAWPTAVACFDGGVFVGVPPDIFYMKDTDGDHRADIKELVFSGFGLANVQGLLNSFNWNLDNQIQGATSGSGALATSTAYPLEAPLTLHGRDFIIDPKARRIAAASGGGQHGLTFDDWGREFVCHNSDHAIQVMFEDRYLARNPFYAAPGPRKSIASDGPQATVFRISPVEPWRVVRTRLRVKGIVTGPIEGGGTASGYFTSATGVTVYRGDAWPAEYRGQLFVADVGSNLIHRKTLTPDGLMLRADRADPGVEFIASTDNWFRPVQFANGPDGCLYVADMYREVIEHPDSLPPVIKKHLDLNSGNDRGRIYRIVPENFTQPKIPALDGVSADQLVAVLGHANAWHAETAQRLLYERAGAAAIPALESSVRASASDTGRMRALYVLRALNALSEDLVLHALHDKNPQVRRHAIRLSESIPAPSDALLDALATLADDTDAEVRYQLAFTLGTWDAPQRIDTLTKLARADGADPLMRVALMTSLSSGAGAVAASLLADPHPAPPELLQALARQSGAAGDPDDTGRLLRAIDGLPEDRSGVRGELVAMVFIGARDAGTGAQLRSALAGSPSTQAQLNARVDRALLLAADPAQSASTRLDAVHSLAFASPAQAVPVLSALLQSGDAELRTASAGTLARFDVPEIAGALIAAIPGRSATDATPIIDALFMRTAWIHTLLQAFAANTISYDVLPSPYRHRLQAHRDGSIRAAAARLEAAHAAPDIQAALALLPAVEAATGDADRGRAIFAERCAACHRIGDLGESIGPDLKSVRDWETARLFTGIANPNGEINPQFTGYNVETTDGRFLSGILESETATGLTLRMSGGPQTALKSQIVHAAPMDISLMPEGLMDGLDPRQIADLIAFIRQE